LCAGHVQQLGGESPLSSLMVAKAFAYALNQWPALTYYANDGWVEIDNNIAENALRAVSLVVKTSCSSALTMVVSGERYCTA